MRLILAVFTVLTSCGGRPPAEPQVGPQKAPVVRCAIDVGSGSTKIKVASVDEKNQKIEKILFEKSQATPYKASLKGGTRLGDEVQETGIQVLSEMIEGARKTTGDAKLSCTGVATEVFRTATNASGFLARLNQIPGIDVKIITQRHEAILGYKGALAAYSQSGRNTDSMSVLVWDIGGASQQMTIRNPDTAPIENYHIYFDNQYASEKWAEEVIKLKASKDKSPNPVGAHVEKALNFLKPNAKRSVGTFQAQIDRSTLVIGIGGVLAKSLPEQIGKSEYTIRQIQEVLETQRKKTDEQLGGAYAKTQVTNLILVLGYMEALGIEKLVTFPVNLTDAILLGAKIP